jgi:integrase
MFITTDGFPYTKNHVYEWWKKIRGVCNLEHRIVYDLRGYYISKRLEEGVEIGQVARMVGTSIQQIHSAYYGRKIDVDSAIKVTRNSDS